MMSTPFGLTIVYFITLVAVTTCNGITSDTVEMLFNGYCYTIVAIRETAYGAENYCRRMDANLIKVDSQALMDALNAKLLAAGYINTDIVLPGLWTGLSIPQWRWADGKI